ncbi:MAG: hypothetical protein ACFFDE_11950, partial [Promethearchaeota archaeon]
EVPFTYQEITDAIERASTIVKNMRKQLPKR